MQAQTEMRGQSEPMSKDVRRREPVAENIPRGKRMAQARERRGLTQEDIADELSVSNGAVGQWETGMSYPTRENEAALAKLLEVSVSWIRSGRDDNPLDKTDAEILNLARKMGTRNKGRLLKYMKTMVERDDLKH